MVHVSNVMLILLAELVHATYQIATLAGQVVELVVEGDLVLPVLHLVVAEVLELGLEVADAAISSLMVVF